jgi:hypothetical protein
MYSSGGAKPGRVHGRDARRIDVYGLARGAEIEQDRRAVGAHINICRLEVKMQQQVRMDLAQAAANAGKHGADERFVGPAAFGLQTRDVFLQRMA